MKMQVNGHGMQLNLHNAFNALVIKLRNTLEPEQCDEICSKMENLRSAVVAFDCISGNSFELIEDDILSFEFYGMTEEEIFNS